MLWKAARSPEGKDATETTQATITETAPCQKAMKIHVGQDAVAPIRAAVLAEFQKSVTLPGFRKGKAPTELVEREYAKPIQDETLHRVTQQTLERTAQAYDLKPVGPFELKAANLTGTDGLTLEATVEVEPSFVLGPYKAIPLSEPSLDVTPEDMAKALAALQESMAQLVPAGESGAKERQLPAIDDELAKDLGFGGLEQLKAHVEAKLREQRRSARTQQMEAVVCDELVKRHAFEVPPRLVSRQTERLTREFKVRLLLGGTPEGQLEGEVAKFTEQLRTSAERYLKLGFILDRIAAQESLTVTQDELVGRLWRLSQQWKKDPAEVRKTFDAQGLWPSVVSAIRQEKTMAFLISAAAMSGT